MKNTYTYYYRLRPPGIGCQPSEGLVSMQGTPDGRKSLEVEGEFFWGSAEYDRILPDEEMERFDLDSTVEILWRQFQVEKQEMVYFVGRIKTSAQIDKTEGRYAIVHPATQPKYEGQWQISFFDDKGPSGHAVAKDKKEIVEKLIEYGFKAKNNYQYNEDVA